MHKEENKMKIMKNDFTRLSNLTNEFKQLANIHSYTDYSMTKTRYVWDIFHFTSDHLQAEKRVKDYLFMRSLYSYLNDNNLQTALIKILC